MSQPATQTVARCTAGILLAILSSNVLATSDTATQPLDLALLDLNGNVFGAFHLTRPAPSLDARHFISSTQTHPTVLQVHGDQWNELEDAAGLPEHRPAYWELDLRDVVQRENARLMRLPGAMF